MTTGMQLRLERVAANLRISEVAAQMGKARQTVTRYETQATVHAEAATAFRDAVRKLQEVRNQSAVA